MPTKPLEYKDLQSSTLCLRKHVCSLLSNTFFNIKNDSKLQVFQKYFCMEIYIWPTLFVKVEKKEKKSYRNFWLSPSNNPNQQIKPHPTRWQYPLINYLTSVYKNTTKLLLKKWTKRTFWKLLTCTITRNAFNGEHICFHWVPICTPRTLNPKIHFGWLHQLKVS